MPDESINESITDDIIVEGVGVFTPPLAPCGCEYVLRFNPDGTEQGWEVEHSEGCAE